MLQQIQKEEFSLIHSLLLLDASLEGEIELVKRVIDKVLLMTISLQNHGVTTAI